MIGRTKIIRVLNRNPWRARVTDAQVPCGGWSTIFLIERPDTASIAFQNFPGVVAGPVVNNDQLVILEGLPENAFDRFGQEARAIIGRDYHAYCRSLNHGTKPYKRARSSSCALQCACEK